MPRTFMYADERDARSLVRSASRHREDRALATHEIAQRDGREPLI